MKALSWGIAGVAVAFVAYIVLNQPGPQYATGDDDVEYAAGRTALWGSKQRLSGSGRGLAGRLKEGRRLAEVSPAGSKRASAERPGTINWQAKGLVIRWLGRSRTQPVK